MTRPLDQEVDWGDLLRIPNWCSIQDLSIDVLAIDDDIYQISSTQYLLTAPYNSPTLEEVSGGPFIVALVWACSQGAVLRACNSLIEADDGVVRNVPLSMLPNRCEPKYRSILKSLKEIGCKGIMEHASYRIVTDRKFVHRSIESGFATYCFRSPNDDDLESPYTIIWSQKDN